MSASEIAMSVAGRWPWWVAGAALLAAGASCATGTLQGITSGPGGSGGGGETASSSTGHGGTGGKGPCTTASDCPGASKVCEVATCTAGVCGTANAPQGTVVSADVPADCLASVCDGKGGTVKGADPSNVPTSSDPCLVGTCETTGVPGTAPAVAGTSCTSASGGQRCDGAGNCVQCLDDSDCPAGQSCGVLDSCMGSPCMDGLLDGNETDVDCGGGTCPACGVGKKCKQDTDCTSNACDPLLHTCLSPQCSDGQKDGNETDVDCGGSCAACGLGKMCSADQDCASQACDGVSLTCVASKCDDQKKDGSETDVDCGGSTCPPCATGQTCLLDGDCISNNCDPGSLTCIVNQCMDGMQDGDETDVDCGGGICPACGLGKMCDSASDCVSQACDGVTSTCDADACSDHVRDGNETDVDCGGADACPRCAVGKGCATSSDCAVGHTCSTGFPFVCH
jgi:Cys-rich repeat protein